MHRSIRDLLFIVVGLCVSAGLLWAARGDSAVRLAGDVAYLNTLGRKAVDAQNLDRSIVTIFRASPARVRELKAAGMGEGDVAAALAAASRLPGGISDASIARVLKYWKAQRGWAEIMKILGLNADRVTLAVERVRLPAAGPTSQTRSATRHKSAPGSLVESGGTLYTP